MSDGESENVYDSVMKLLAYQKFVLTLLKLEN